MLPGLPTQVEDAAALPRLDTMWHYGCVIGPPSHCAVRGSALSNSGATPSSLSTARKSRPFVLPAAPSTASSSPLSSSASSYSQADRYRNWLAADRPSDHHHPQLPALHRVFHTFDEDGDGKVSVNEISRMLQRLGIEYSEESLTLEASYLVSTSEAHVEEDEFLAVFAPLLAEANSSSLHADVDEDLVAAFHVFDKDRDGFISPTELQEVLCALGFTQGGQLDACVDMIARVDENGDGLVDLGEFKRLFLLAQS